MQKKHFVVALLVLCWVFLGCASYIDTREMNLVTENKSGKILNLKYAGDAEEKYTAMAEKMVKNGFLNAQGKEYGYYDIRYEITTKDYKPGITSCLDIPLFWIAVPFGFPTGGENFTLAAHFYIFDSNGNFVKRYSNTTAYEQYVNLYRWGNSATKKGAQEFTKLLNVIFDEAAGESNEINGVLQKAGPVSNNNMAEVQGRIDKYFKENPSYYAK